MKKPQILTYFHKVETFLTCGKSIKDSNLGSDDDKLQRKEEKMENKNLLTTDRNLYSKEQANELTKDYTPQRFLGDINNEWTGSLNSLKYQAEDNAPESLNLGGYDFKRLGNPFTTLENNKNIILLEYQSTEQVGKEYPVLQVGIRVWRTKGGKVKSEIIRDGYTNKTRFW